MFIRLCLSTLQKTGFPTIVFALGNIKLDFPITWFFFEIGKTRPGFFILRLPLLCLLHSVRLVVASGFIILIVLVLVYVFVLAACVCFRSKSFVVIFWGSAWLAFCDTAQLLRNTSLKKREGEKDMMQGWEVVLLNHKFWNWWRTICWGQQRKPLFLQWLFAKFDSWILGHVKRTCRVCPLPTWELLHYLRFSLLMLHPTWIVG